MNERITAAREARELAQRNDTAVLSTISKKLMGYPFGSVSPFMLSAEGQVIFYVSDIAQHARNLSVDNRLSITVFDAAERGDQNTQGRLTLTGNARLLEDESLSELYFLRFPDALSYRNAHDFKFWQMDVEHIRYIGGFGEIFWINPGEWLLPEPEWNSDEALAMIQHMNEDHADACRLILRQQFAEFRHVNGSVKMISVYPEGFHLMADARSIFIPFETTCATAGEVRMQLVKMTHAARGNAVA
ncbi:HugZ family pyridoxamine 5'-phosphate oxidase [Idiomarina aminovorans]|uniref:HugZ family pyridoxamine 5'-phosphate oxidase n=1 Tax=Idiomarina aminovorans TaxID=2914829 RepID=UPI002003813A|nr:DUF2470 domain-containing protein [Idiomarina sp. ATCH4]MCK7460365.1 DUF2470 domain-containing protein [Idiomarina sp. ATCH4]